MPDEHEKLAPYRRLAEARTPEAIDDFTLELRDRFGAMPAPAVALVELRRIRVLGRGTPGSAPVETLKVFQAVAEVTLRRPLRPDEIKSLVTGLDFQAEFFSGRGSACVRGEGHPVAASAARRCWPWRVRRTRHRPHPRDPARAAPIVRA